MTGFVLLFAVACLGGVIATVGDRIGMKVGKSRLSLFNLRPRQTATLVSVVTGMVASFSTLMLLIALDSQLRKGLFQLDDIQQELSVAQTDLESTRAEKDAVESNLEESTLLQEEARARLRETNRSLRLTEAREEETLDNLLATQEQLDTVSEQALSLGEEIDALRAERQALVDERAEVLAQISQRDQEIAQRNQQLSEQSSALESRNAELSQRDEQIAERDEQIDIREARLEELQQQRQVLDEQIAQLGVDFANLRLGNVAISSGRILEVTLARSNTEGNARRAVESALLKANSTALRLVWPGIEEINAFVLDYDQTSAAQIVQNTFDERSYAIVVSSEENYVVGEPCVSEILQQPDGSDPCLRVNMQALVNEVLYLPGEPIATIQIKRDELTEARLRDRFFTLGELISLQAQRNGIINPNPIIARRLSEPVIEFWSQVAAYGEPLSIQAIASQPVYTLGPVYVELTAVKDGEVLFDTQSVLRTPLAREDDSRR
ncbi:MAG: DUF3084 domain-containing protein [Cyanobacteria bacterium J06621_3]